VKRYQGQALPSDCRVAVLANDALGNFAVCNPLLQVIRFHYPLCTLDYYGGERTRELEEASLRNAKNSSSCRLLDWRTSVRGVKVRDVFRHALRRLRQVKHYHLVINIEASEPYPTLCALLGVKGFVVGPCLAPDGRGMYSFLEDERGRLWADPDWKSPNLLARYPFLTTGFISEIFIKGSYLTPIPGSPWAGEVPKYSFPKENFPLNVEGIVATGASLPEKMWPTEKWMELLSWLKTVGMRFALIGAPPKKARSLYASATDDDQLVQKGLVEDWRGKLTLPEVVGALSQAKLVISVDNGIVHLAAMDEAPTVALYRPGFERLWAPPNPNLIRISPEEGGVAEIPVETVFRAIETVLAERR
jgi:ADP-heptose:LPS heptosyltransferase